MKINEFAQRRGVIVPERSISLDNDKKSAEIEQEDVLGRFFLSLSLSLSLYLSLSLSLPDFFFSKAPQGCSEFATFPFSKTKIDRPKNPGLFAGHDLTRGSNLGGNRNLTGRVGSGRVESGRVYSGRVYSGPVRRFPYSHGLGPYPTRPARFHLARDQPWEKLSNVRTYPCANPTGLR